MLNVMDLIKYNYKIQITILFKKMIRIISLSLIILIFYFKLEIYFHKIVHLNNLFMDYF